MNKLIALCCTCTLGMGLIASTPVLAAPAGGNGPIVKLGEVHDTNACKRSCRQSSPGSTASCTPSSTGSGCTCTCTPAAN